MSVSKFIVACLSSNATTNLLSSALVARFAPEARVYLTLAELMGQSRAAGAQGWVQLTLVAEMPPSLLQKACAQARAMGLPVVFLHRGQRPNAAERMLIRDFCPDQVVPVTQELDMIRTRSGQTQPVEA